MSNNFFIYLAVMAGVTYLIRMLPLVLFKKKIQNRFIQSFMYYIPYAVLSAMTIPDIFTSTGNIAAGVAGLIVAVVLALFERGLLTVAICACAVAYVTPLIQNLFK